MRRQTVTCSVGLDCSSESTGTSDSGRGGVLLEKSSVSGIQHSVRDCRNARTDHPLAGRHSFARINCVSWRRRRSLRGLHAAMLRWPLTKHAVATSDQRRQRPCARGPTEMDSGQTRHLTEVVLISSSGGQQRGVGWAVPGRACAHV